MVAVVEHRSKNSSYWYGSSSNHKRTSQARGKGAFPRIRGTSKEGHVLGQPVSFFLGRSSRVFQLLQDVSVLLLGLLGLRLSLIGAKFGSCLRFQLRCKNSRLAPSGQLGFTACQQKQLHSKNSFTVCLQEACLALCPFNFHTRPRAPSCSGPLPLTYCNTEAMIYTPVQFFNPFNVPGFAALRRFKFPTLPHHQAAP